MRHDIVHGEPFEQSEAFQTVLQGAVGRRWAFTGHVDETVDALISSGARPGVKDYIKVPEELISAIKEAASAIWEKYWSLWETRRQETLTQLEALKWKPFHEIGG